MRLYTGLGLVVTMVTIAAYGMYADPKSQLQEADTNTTTPAPTASPACEEECGKMEPGSSAFKVCQARCQAILNYFNNPEFRRPKDEPVLKPKPRA